MLHNIQQQNIVEATSINRKLAAVQVALDELVQVAVTIHRKLVNAGDAALLLFQTPRHVTAGTADIGHGRARPHALQSQAVGTLKMEFGLIKDIVLGGPADVELALVQDAVVLRSTQKRGAEHVKGIPDTLDVADLVTII